MKDAQEKRTKVANLMSPLILTQKKLEIEYEHVHSPGKILILSMSTVRQLFLILCMCYVEFDIKKIEN